MMLEVTDQEREMLTLLLRRELDELGPEIHHTWRRDYREDLKDEKRIMADLLHRLAILQPH
jgi:hypothetical protein